MLLGETQIFTPEVTDKGKEEAHGTLMWDPEELMSWDT